MIKSDSCTDCSSLSAQLAYRAVRYSCIKAVYPLLTQPSLPTGQYGGRKVLSRAFRSRFLELHVSDLPDSELEFILQQRCALAPSYSKKLVAVMRDLYRTRQVRAYPSGLGVSTHQQVYTQQVFTLYK